MKYSINDSRKNKTLTFEGVGWSGADTSKASDLPNCRIRATFINDEGLKIYLELTGTIPSNYSPESMKKFKVYGHISSIFLTTDQKSNYSHWYFDYKKIRNGIEYNKKELLKFIKKHCNAAFESIEVENDSDYCGFSHTGIEIDNFHNDKPRQVEHCGYSTEQTFATALTFENDSKLHEQVLKAVMADNVENCIDNLRSLIRRNKEAVYNMAVWAWDNCSPEFPDSVVNMKELVFYFKSKLES